MMIQDRPDINFLSPLERERTELATVLGLPITDLRSGGGLWSQLRRQGLDLMRQGVLVKVQVGRPSFTTSIQWPDLGIPGERDRQHRKRKSAVSGPLSIGDLPTQAGLDDLMDLGKKLLLPRPILMDLANIETRARRSLDMYAYRTSFWEHFIPVTVYQAWKQVFEGYVGEYFNLRDDIISRYPALTDQVLSEYEGLAQRAYQRLMRIAEVGWMSGRDMESEKVYVEHFLCQIRSHMPTVEALLTGFRMEAVLTYIPLPSLLAEDRAWQDKQARLSADEDVRTRELTAMHRDVLSQVRVQQEEMIGSFLTDLAGQLRSLVYDVCIDVLASLRKHRQLQGSSVRQLQHLIDQVQALNFFGDADLTQAMERVSAHLSVAPQDRNIPEISRTLVHIGTFVRASLLNLGDTPRSGRDWDVPDLPEFEVVRGARQRLGLPELHLNTESSFTRGTAARSRQQAWQTDGQ